MRGHTTLTGRWHWTSLRLKKRAGTKTARFTPQAQGQWFLLVHDLLTVGFSLQHALHFTGTVMPTLQPILDDVERQMAAGEMLATGLKKYVGQDLYYQLRLAEEHGALNQTLKELGTLRITEVRQRRKLRGLLQYPLLLIGMLAVVTGGLAIFVYPELNSWNSRPGGGWQSAGLSLGAYLLTVAVLVGGLQWWRWHHLSTCQRMVWRCRLPFFGLSFRLYYGYYLTTNLAGMFRHGLSLKEVIQVTSQYDRRSLLYQFSAIIKELVAEGKEVDQVIIRYPFIPNELVVFINKGLTLEELGDELAVFAQLQFKRLVQSIERMLVWVQPVIFVLIALTIVALYLSILLPIYHSLQGVA